MEQMSFFGNAAMQNVLQAFPPVQQTNNVVPFKKPSAAPVHKRGGTVYPLKDQGDIKKISTWLMENKQPKYFLAWSLGINFGLRANELLSLNVEDVYDLETRTVRHNGSVQDVTDVVQVLQSKTDKRRSLYINEGAKDALMWYRTVDPGVFSRQKLFNHMGYDSLYQALKEAATSCGIKYNFGTHSMRKTFGYWHFMKNHDITYLQKLFGHRDSSTTLRYIGIVAEQEKAAYYEVSFDTVSLVRDNEGTAL